MFTLVLGNFQAGMCCQIWPLPADMLGTYAQRPSESAQEPICVLLFVPQAEVPPLKPALETRFALAIAAPYSTPIQQTPNVCRAIIEPFFRDPNGEDRARKRAPEDKAFRRFYKQRRHRSNKKQF
jgi:hypothetical protein